MRHLSSLTAILLLSLVSLAGGLAVGRILWRAPQRSDAGVAEPSGEADSDAEPDIHVDLTPAAVRSLGLRFGRVAHESFRESIQVPGTVTEKPGRSGVVVPSPTNGIIRRIHRFPGQVLNPDDLLFTLRVMDEALETAQLSLLETLSRIRVTERELTRLDPLAETGAIVGRRTLEMEYELEQLRATREARLQELRLRGLDDDHLSRILDERELVSEIEIRLDRGHPADGIDSGEHGSASASRSPSAASPSAAGERDDFGPADAVVSGRDSDALFTIESIDVFPGRAVKKGEELAHIASHQELYLRGEAFESDVPAIREAVSRGWKVEADFGETGPEPEELEIAYIDNHVDATSNTFPFYMTLANRVVSQRRDASGRTFWSWKYKPGQRSHLRIPVAEWRDQIVLPRDATVRVGPETMAFRLDLDPSPGDSGTGDLGTGDSGTEAGEGDLDRILAGLEFFELEPVSVELLHQDRQWCVIADDGALAVGDIVALNHSYQLHLAWRLQRSGGDLLDHDHDH